MANLSIRKLNDNIYQKLRSRAISHKVSMEEEARQILSKAIDDDLSIFDVFSKYFGQKNGVDLILPPQNTPHSPINFSE